MNEQVASMGCHATEATTRFAHLLHDRCYVRQEIPTDQRYPPVACGSYDLNISKSYASWIEGFGSLRELVQNWFDRTTEVLGGGAALPYCHVRDSGWVDDTRLLFHEREDGQNPLECASYILEQRLSDDHVYIQLTNFSTEISKDMLVMGCSRKGKSAAGAYGEGMKIEINRLVARGVLVKIFTGCQMWEFYHATEQGSTESKLWMTVSQTGDLCNHLSICLQGTREMFGSALIDRSKFLFLQPQGVDQPMDPAFRSGRRSQQCRCADPACTDPKCWPLVEILLHDNHAGKVYARGIFVCEEPLLKRIGFNFVGGVDTHRAFQFTRDRDSISINTLISNIPVICVVEQLRNSDVHSRIVRRIYEILEIHHTKLNILSYGKDHWTESALYLEAEARMADGLVQVFAEKHRHVTTPYPVEDPVDDVSSTRTGPFGTTRKSEESLRHIKRLEDERAEATYLQCTPVPVPRPLLNLLRKSKDCPTLSVLWRQHELSIYNAPEWVSPNQEQTDNARKLVTLAIEWFGGLEGVNITQHTLRFKVFAAGNKRPVVPGRSPDNTRILAVDMTLLWDVAATHAWVFEQFKVHCHDPVQTQAGPSCGGTCTLLRYSESLLMCLQQMYPHLRGALEQRQKLGMLRMQSHDWRKVPLPPPSAPIPSPKTPSPTDDADSNDDASNPRPRTPLAGAAERSNQIGGVGVVVGSQTSDEDLVRLCLTGTNGQPAGRTQWVTPLLEACNTTRTDDLELIDMEMFPGVTSPLPLYHHWPGGPETLQQVGCTHYRVAFMAEFASFISMMSTQVFSLPPSACMRVFWKDCNVIAFNRKGKLFFNALYAYKEGHTVQLSNTWTYWFVIFCHELAHNASSDHDKRHEYAEETLIQNFMERMMVKMSDAGVDMKGW
eukprot:GFYU01012208.1.p1 GENE.GFYU01012208.1~~GFYU01012208.1.p1  ORF type:complete len:893 (-),score=166.06 GFYU01012208.1:101-2779(-)